MTITLSYRVRLLPVALCSSQYDPQRRYTETTECEIVQVNGKRLSDRELMTFLRLRLLVLGNFSRSVSTCSNSSLAYLKPEDHKNSFISITTTPSGLTDAQRTCLDTAIRVDQAGEVAANWIYRGQMAVLGRDREAGPVIQVRYPHNECCLSIEQVYNEGYVGPGEEAS